jgi:hypothetical protein
MNSDNLLSIFPQKRIKPYDGMSVTAEVWGQAHEYHRQAYQSHNLFFHGSGILIGMEVVASDPADAIVFIMPGVAVDSAGAVIVLSEPVAYDLGDEIEGPLYLTITHRESSRGAKKQNGGDELAFLQDEFLITARPSLPGNAAVELARFTRESRTSVMRDAANPAGPGINEIDLRYRSPIEMHSQQLLTAAVVYLGSVKEPLQGQGLVRLADQVRRRDSINLVVDDGLQLDPGVLGYSFLYLVGEGKFQLTKAQLKGLQGYVERGGFLLMESCDEKARESFLAAAEAIGMEMKTPMEKDHPLLAGPYFFAAPPSGFESDGDIRVGDGGLLSTFNYGRLWSGAGRERVPSREEIRSAVEWGANLLSHVLEVREKAQAG